MRRRGGCGCAGVVVLVALATAGPASAETWAGITPGETTRQEVEARHGRPTRERMLVEEGRTVPEWTYLTDRAPRGLDRMVVSFGFLRPEGFTADVVRAVVIYPKPRVFTLEAIGDGWGTPDAIGTDEQTGRPAFRYDARGLLIILDRTGAWAEVLLFAPTPASGKP